MTEQKTRQDVLSLLYSRNILPTPEIMSFATRPDAYNLIHSYLNVNPDVEDIDIKKVMGTAISSTHNQEHGKKISSSVSVIDDDIYSAVPGGFEISKFTAFFSSRYSKIAALLRMRSELSGTISISRAKSKKNQSISLIGMVISKEFTKNGHYILQVEDTTGHIKAIIRKNSPAFEIAHDVVEDSVIGLTGTALSDCVFIDNVFFPDVPASNSLKKAPSEAYVVFLSDIHVGSNNFLETEFKKFISWINCSAGSDQQKNLARNVKYIFIAGDLVDGVGVYPNQDSELTIPDIRNQYKRCAELLSAIPAHIKIVISPGNHDYVRIAEPQPAIDERFAPELCAMSNVLSVPNPSYLNIGASPGFQGFDILMYHGNSFDYFIANVDSIRQQGGYDRADLIMKFLLKNRHLSPTYSATQIIPVDGQDPLVISRIPDFFVTGHIHKTSVANYRGMTLISGSCWQSTTAFQEKVGHKPEPARVPVVNLKDRSVRILKFS